MPKYWIAVASREHVLRGVAGNFCQVCHGKGAHLFQMGEGDGLIYYSPTFVFGEKTPCRMFTAIGKIQRGEAYQFEMAQDFIPWRRDVAFFSAIETPIVSLLDELSFIKDKKKWGFPFRRGCFTIPFSDFALIAEKMRPLHKSLGPEKSNILAPVSRACLQAPCHADEPTPIGLVRRGDENPR